MSGRGVKSREMRSRSNLGDKMLSFPLKTFESEMWQDICHVTKTIAQICVLDKYDIIFFKTSLV